MKFKRLLESMSRHCFIYKAKDGKWYMELADNEYEERWQSFTYGPFTSENNAMAYLRRFSNPGGVDTDTSGKLPAPNKSPNGLPIRKP